ncbi:MAG TPA: hypothetical protein VN823_02055 [Stellaceae bacterium]|nr:hypothetical protein [Stellaceae bacterium]
MAPPPLMIPLGRGKLGSAGAVAQYQAARAPAHSLCRARCHEGRELFIACHVIATPVACALLPPIGGNATDLPSKWVEVRVHPDQDVVAGN